MKNGKQILLVEDDESLCVALSQRLEAEGYTVKTVTDGSEADDLLRDHPFDLVVLDLMLPGKSGLDLCRDFRRRDIQTPVIMLTARAEVYDKVVGLKIGADDYVTKPFEVAEFLARVEALVRRAAAGGKVDETPVRFGPFELNLRRTELTKSGDRVPLAAKEYQLLRHFLMNRGKTIPRGDLLKEVWGFAYATSTRTLDVHVSALRQKLEDDPKSPRWILTVHGIGYRFSE